MECLNVTLVSPKQKDCGIQVYTDFMLRSLARYATTTWAGNTGSTFRQLAATAKKADIVHVQYEPGAFGSIGRLRGTHAPLFFHTLTHPKKAQVVTTLHEMHESRVRGIRSLLVHLYQRFINYFVLHNSDAVIVHSRSMEQFVRSKGIKAVFLPHPGSLRAAPLPSAHAKEKRSLQGKRVLLGFGFVEPRKGYEQVIQALPELPEDIVLVIAGQSRESGSYVPFLKKRIQEKNVEERVIFTGFVDEREVPVIFAASDLVVLPYTDIYQSGALCNAALGYGKPVLASDIPGFREFREEFNAVALAGPGEWREKILELLTDNRERERLMQQARAYVRNNSWDSIAEKTVSLYQNLLSGTTH